MELSRRAAYCMWMTRGWRALGEKVPYTAIPGISLSQSSEESGGRRQMHGAGGDGVVPRSLGAWK